MTIRVTHLQRLLTEEAMRCFNIELFGIAYPYAGEPGISRRLVGRMGNLFLDHGDLQSKSNWL